MPQLETWPAAQACALTGASNQRPFGSQAATQSTKPHKPGLIIGFFLELLLFCYTQTDKHMYTHIYIHTLLKFLIVLSYPRLLYLADIFWRNLFYVLITEEV